MSACAPLCSCFVRIKAVARVQLLEILRAHPFRLFVPAAAVVVLGAPALIFFSFGHRANMVAQVGLSTATLAAVLIGLLAGSAGPARERERGTRDLLMARSLHPAAYVLGKWLGIVSGLAPAVLFLGAVHSLSLAARGGAPQGYGPIVGALVVAFVYGALAAAIGLFFSCLLRAGPAFVASLAFVGLAHVVPMVAESPVPSALSLVLPRLASLNLAVESSFGPVSAALYASALCHGLAASAFFLALAVAAARGKT